MKIEVKCQRVADLLHAQMKVPEIMDKKNWTLDQSHSTRNNC